LRFFRPISASCGELTPRSLRGRVGSAPTPVRSRRGRRPRSVGRSLPSSVFGSGTRGFHPARHEVAHLSHDRRQFVVTHAAITVRHPATGAPSASSLSAEAVAVVPSAAANARDDALAQPGAMSDYAPRSQRSKMPAPTNTEGYAAASRWSAGLDCSAAKSNADLSKNSAICLR
jgi:hypothetical protein